jgi:hypothetical protein
VASLPRIGPIAPGDERDLGLRTIQRLGSVGQPGGVARPVYDEVRRDLRELFGGADTDDEVFGVRASFGRRDRGLATPELERHPLAHLEAVQEPAIDRAVEEPKRAAGAHRVRSQDVADAHLELGRLARGLAGPALARLASQLSLSLGGRFRALLGVDLGLRSARALMLFALLAELLGDAAGVLFGRQALRDELIA